MNRAHRLTFQLLIVVISMTLVSYIQNPSNLGSNYRIPDNNCLTISSPTKCVENITLILNITDGDTSIFHQLTLEGDITAFNATIVGIGEENINYYSTAAGVFVKGMSINNTWYSDTGSHFWLYWVNGIFGGISCSKFEITNNSIVEWKYTGENPYEGEPTEGEFWFYIALFSGIAIACGLAIYLIIKRGV